MVPILLFAMILSVNGESVSGDTSPTAMNSCRYLQNISEVETLNRHQYTILEQCLYYFLVGEAQKTATFFAGIHALAAMPPNYNQKRPIEIRFHQITLQHYELNEFMKELNIQGYMDVSWEDPRLAWDEKEWRVNTLSINSVSHIWVPIITAQSYETALRNGDLMEMRRIQANSSGSVNVIMNFALKTFCDDTNFKNYPDDIYRCCFELEPHLNQELMDFVSDGHPIYTDPKYFRDYGWLLSGSIPEVQKFGARANQLNFCVNLQRASNSVRIELTLPTMITAFLFLLSPFLGKIYLQIIMKLFILFLQFLTLQIFSNRISPHLGSVSATPKILRFHEYAMIMNTLSISISILLWMCARVKRNLPPWRWLIQLSQVVNSVFCVFNTPEIDLEAVADKTTPSNNYQVDWVNAFTAIHGASVIGISIFFLLGYLLFF